MAAKSSPPPAASPSPLRLALEDYWRQSRRPLASLAFVVPLLVLYEGGVLLLGPQAVRNGADVWLRQLLDLAGMSQYFLLPVLTIGLLLAWHHVARDRWQLSVGVLYGMLIECAALGLLLVGIARFEGLVAHGMLVAPTDQGTTLAVAWGLAGRGAFVGRMLGFVGAGVYEEMLFRLLLLPPVAIFAKQLGAQPHLRTVAAVVLTSVVFALAHYVGPYGEPFDAFTFGFRLTAGAIFAVIFVCRGFGIAAGTHALYDIFVSVL